MALSFPTSPAAGDQYIAPNGVTYTWNATLGIWASSGISGAGGGGGGGGVTSVTASAPIASSGGATPVISATLADAATAAAGTSAVTLMTPQFAVPKNAAGMTGAAILPNGTTAQRPGAPVAGMTRFNSTDTSIEFYDGAKWVPLAPNVPACSVYATAIQNVTSGVNTKVVNLNGVIFDNYNFFDTANSRFQPLVPGYYQVSALIRQGSALSDMTQSMIIIYKNGSSYQRLTEVSLQTGTFSVSQAQGSTLVYMNGTTDYLEMWGYILAPSQPSFLYFSPAVTSFFSAVLVAS